MGPFYSGYIFLFLFLFIFLLKTLIDIINLLSIMIKMCNDLFYQMLCQFWIISFCKARRACYLTALSWLYLAFSMISYLIWKLSITLHKRYRLLSTSRIESTELS